MNPTSVIELTKKLCSFASVSHDIEQLHACIDYIHQWFLQFDGIYTKKVVHREKPSLLVQNYVGLHADIVLNGHIDVVPPSEENQFAVQEREGRLYGRGTGDMKAGVALMMQLMKEILTEHITDKKVLLMITSDEEIGGTDGVERLVDQGYTGDVVLIPDGGATNKISFAQKGMYHMTVEAKGVAAHSSRPREGSNAIHNIVNYVIDIRQQLQETKEAYFSDDHRGTTVNFNVVHAGTAINQVPDTALAKIDIRYTETYTAELVQKKALDNMPSFQCRLVEDLLAPIFFMDANGPVFQQYMQCARTVLGEEPQLVKEHGASDGRHFAEKGCVVIVHRPTCENIHGPQERVDIAGISDVYKIYKAFVSSTA